MDLILFIWCFIRKHICYKIYTILASAWLHFICILFLHYASLIPIFLAFLIELMIPIFRWIFAYWISWLHRQVRRCPWLPNRQARSRQIDVMLFRGGEGRNKLARYLPRMMKRNPRHEVACVEIPLPTVSKCIYNCFIFFSPFLSTHA